MLCEGFLATGVPEAEQLARDLARRWLASNFIAYGNSRVMFEKLDARRVGSSGGGGEVRACGGW